MATETLNNAVANKSAQYITGASLKPKVNVADKSGVVSVKDYQVPIVPEMHGIAQIQPLNLQSTFNGQPVDFRLIKGCVPYLKDLAIQIKITETGGANPVTVTQAPFLFQYIEFWGNSGADRIQTLYPEQMLAHFGLFLSEEQQMRLAKNANFTVPTAGLPGLTGGNYSQETSIATSGTTTLYWPLFGNFIAQNDGLFIGGLENDMIIRFYLRNGVVVSGSGTAGLTNLTLLLEYNTITDQEYSDHVQEYKSKTVEFDYLDTTLFTSANTFTAGVQTPLQLQPFIGWSPYFLMMFRSTPTTVTANAHMNAVSLGSGNLGALIEIDNAAGNIITGNAPFNADYMLNVTSPKYFPGNLQAVLNWYVFVFGDPAAAENKVIHKGFMPFTGNEYIKITPSSAGTAETAEVQTLTPLNSGTSAALSPSAGNYQLNFGPLGSTIPLAFNASIATIQAAVNTLLTTTLGRNGQPITCTVSGTIWSAATTGVIFTFANLGYVPSAQGILISASGVLNNGTIGVSINSALTTAGVVATGFTTATLTLNIYGRMFRHTHIKKGYWEVGSLTA